MSVEAKEEATEMTFQQVFEKENVELKEGLLKLFQNQGFPKDQIMQMKMREVEAVLVKVLQKQVNEVVDYLGKLTGEMEQFKKVRRWRRMSFETSEKVFAFKTRGLEDSIRDIKNVINSVTLLKEGVYWYLALIKRLNLPENVEETIRCLQAIIGLLQAIGALLIAIQVISGPWGWAMLAVGAAVGVGVYIYSQMEMDARTGNYWLHPPHLNLNVLKRAFTCPTQKPQHLNTLRYCLIYMW